MHHLPSGPSRSARLAAAVGRGASRARQVLLPSPRRAVPLLVIGVVLAVLGVAAPVVSEAMTGGSGGAAPAATASALRDGGIRMGVDGDQSPAPSSTSGQRSAGASTPAADGPAGSPSPALSGTATTGIGESSTVPGATTGATTDPTGSTGAPSATVTDPSSTAPAASPAEGSPDPAASPAVPSPGTPTPDVPGTSASPAAGPAVPGTTDAVLTSLNATRTGAGCAPLAADPALTDVAQAHSVDMAGSGAQTVSGLAGRTAVVAQGPADAASAVALWLGDPTQRALLLDCDRTSLGAGEAIGTAGPWWTVVVA